MELERRSVSSWLSGGGSALARRVLMPWTCRKDRPASMQRRVGGGSGALIAARIHPTESAARRLPVRGRRAWKNLFPVNGQSICARCP